mmetsp:Transcript_29864/g.44148  ORF Transcript_29864/g.44148 Transcript_29864/m.44148 type:complete len:238 (+) Transcript_29864:235-948(+)
MINLQDLSNVSFTLWIFSLTIIIMLYFIGSLFYSILFPTIISFPWDEQIDKNHKGEGDCVIMAGSFNPPHRGHYAMLEYLSKRHAHVVCVVGKNPNKKYLVTPEDRAELLKKALASSSNAGNITVEVVSDYIWRYAKKQHPKKNLIFYRGIRSWEKDGHEERALQILNTWGPMVIGWTWPIPTRYLAGQPKYNHISSTLIRNILETTDSAVAAKKELSALVPDSTVEQVWKLYSPPK